MNPIHGVSQTPLFTGPEFPEAPGKVQQPAFKEFMLEAIDQVNSMQLEANHAVEQLMTGGDVNAAEVLTAIQKADLSFRMMMQIRNKLVQAYEEVKEIRI